MYIGRCGMMKPNECNSNCGMCYMQTKHENIFEIKKNGMDGISFNEIKERAKRVGMDETNYIRHWESTGLAPDAKIKN